MFSAVFLLLGGLRTEGNVEPDSRDEKRRSAEIPAHLIEVFYFPRPFASVLQYYPDTAVQVYKHTSCSQGGFKIRAKGRRHTLDALCT